jgi:hypothetical protein
MQILDELKAIIKKLDEAGVPYALCGGLAMAIYAMPRATLDIDLMIEMDSLPRSRGAMEGLGFTLDAAPMVFRGGKVRISRLCKVDPESGEALVLGLLLVTPETRKAWESRCQVDWEDRKMTVVSPKGLIALKSLRASGQERDDIDYLRNITDEDSD